MSTREQHTTEESAVQLPLWDRAPQGALSPPVGAPFPRDITPDSTVAVAIHWFAQHLRSTGRSEETTRTYTMSMSLFARYVGGHRKLSQIEKAHVSGFLAWLRDRRGRGRTSAKTIEVRGTALRTFFAALEEEGILPDNPARDVYPRRASTPLPEVLFYGEVDRVYQTAARLAEEESPRVQPYLLLILTLGMGLRLGEISRLTRGDVDLSDSFRPVVHVRYKAERHRHKARTLIAPPEFAVIYRKHLDSIEDHELFPVTQRALEYDIEGLGTLAELPRKLTARTLRWTWAVRKMKQGVDGKRLRKLMGLSPIGWDGVKQILGKLTAPPIG